MNDLLGEHVAHIYRFALRLTRDRHKAEDLTQEVCLRAIRAADQLRSARSARVWLLRIAANLWTDEMRKPGSVTVKEIPESVDTHVEVPLTRAIQIEDQQAALAALDSLPDRQRQTLYLFAVEELSISEIAVVIGSRPETVKVNLSLARRSMRKRLPDLAGDLSVASKSIGRPHEP